MKKLYRNSECEECNCYLCTVKLKGPPEISEWMILCRDCFKKIFLKEKEEKEEKDAKKI